MIPFFEIFRNRLNSLFYILFLILISISSFFFGRMSKIFEEKPIFSQEIVKSENFALNNNSFKNQNISTSTIVASKRGTKYYYIWCKSSESIKTENRVYFQSEREAEAKGLILANNCK